MKPITAGAVFVSLALCLSTYAGVPLTKKQVAVSLSRAAYVAMRAAIAEKPDRQAGDILATGSMKPTLDENYIVVVEKTPFEKLKPGRIVIFSGAWTKDMLCHRLVRKAANAWITRGDCMDLPDPHPMTAERYAGYAVVGAIHKTTGALKPL